MKKTIWQPLVLGGVLGMLAGIATVTSLSFLTPGITDSAIGFYVTLFLLATAQGGPLAGALASTLWVIISALFGPPDMKAIIGIPSIFWSNLLALGTFTALVGVAYRWIFEHMKMPARLLPWTGVVIAFYLITLPSAIILQYYLLGDPASEILPAILATYMTYIPQVIFDIVFTSLIFIALPARYRRPLWYELKKAPVQNSEVQSQRKAGAQ